MTPPTAELTLPAHVATEKPERRSVDELAAELGCSVSQPFPTENPDYDSGAWSAFTATAHEHAFQMLSGFQKIQLEVAGSAGRLERDRSVHIKLGPIMEALKPCPPWLHLEAVETPEQSLEDLAAKLGHEAVVYRDHSPDPRPGAVILVPLGEWINEGLPAE